MIVKLTVKKHNPSGGSVKPEEEKHERYRYVKNTP